MFSIIFEYIHDLINQLVKSNFRVIMLKPLYWPLTVALKKYYALWCTDIGAKTHFIYN